MKLARILIFIHLFCFQSFGQNNSVIVENYTILVHFVSTLDSNNAMIDEVLQRKDTRLCKKIELFNVKNELPINIYRLNWITSIVLRGTYNIQNGDSILENLVISKNFNKLVSLTEFRSYYVGIKKIEKTFHPPNLKTIIIAEDVLTEIPHAIFGCKELGNLTITRNRIKAISTKICYLKKLEYLNLELNSIQSIPVCIGNISSLKAVNLMANKIEFVPVDLSKISSLEYLDLAANPITSIPQEIKNMKRLKRLSIDMEGGWDD